MAEHKIRDLMKRQLVTLPGTATVADAARCMRDENIGAVVVQGDPLGLVTDRDIAVRAVAAGRDPQKARLSEIASTSVLTLAPDDDADRAVDVMREHCVRRIPIVEDGRPIGILSLGDLAIERDRASVLGSISAAPPSR